MLALRDLAKVASCSREGTKNPPAETHRLGTEELARMCQMDETGRGVLLFNGGDVLLVGYFKYPFVYTCAISNIFFIKCNIGLCS